MSERGQYQPGVPCWIDTLGGDPGTKIRFYGALFGWEFAGPGPMRGDPPGQYFVARLRGRDVAGIGTAPEPAPPPAWTTHIAVGNADEAVRRARNAGAEILAGPVDARPAGRLAVLRDPGGAVFCAWEAGDRQGAQLVNEPGAWAMSLLQTGKPERAKAFYETLFGWEYEEFDLGGATAALCRLPGYTGGEPRQPVPRDVVAVMLATEGGGASRWNVDLWTDDADAAAARTPALGGTVIQAPHETPGFRRAVLADPQGVVFSVSARQLEP